MPKFRKKPVEIEALHSTGYPESNRAIIDWTRDSDTPAFMGDMEGDHQTLHIRTLEGDHKVTPGDWVIRGVHGEHYPCKPDIFKKTYDKVE